MTRSPLILIGCFIAWFQLVVSAALFISPQWQSINPLSFGVNVRFLAVGADKVIGVGDFGTVLSSTNGLQWKAERSPGLERLNAAAYGAGRWVVVGEEGAIYSSPDLQLWRKHSTGATSDFVGVRHGDGKFIAWTWPGIAFVSEDGENWTFNQIPSEVKDIILAEGITVIVKNGIYTSLDRKNWNQPQSGATAAAYGNNTFYSIAPNIGLVSEDGVIWQHRSTTVAGKKLIATTNGIFSLELNEGSRVFRSNDGFNYSLLTSTAPALLDVVNYNGVFVGIGTLGLPYTSTNGVDWNSLQEHLISPSSERLQMFVDSEGILNVYNYDEILITPDLTNWTTRVSGPESYRLWDVTEKDGALLAIGADLWWGKKLFRKEKTGNWEALGWDANRILELEFGNGVFVAAGHEGRLFWSVDGNAWIQVPVPKPENFLSLSFNQGTFTALGYTVGMVGHDLSSIATSSDGRNWEFRKPAGNHSLPVQYQDGYIAAGPDIGFTSRMGIYWTSRDLARIHELPFSRPVEQLLLWKDTILVISGRNLVQSSPVVLAEMLKGTQGPALRFTGLQAGKEYTIQESSNVQGEPVREMKFIPAQPEHLLNIGTSGSNRFLFLKAGEFVN